MSHFVGLCFGDRWESNLELYCEYNDVDPYIAYYKKDAINTAQLQHSEDYQRAIEMLKKDNLDPNSSAIYTAIKAKGPTLTEEQAWDSIQDWGYEINEDGNLISRYNPDSKWDWYSIGGRWSGFLPLKELDSEGNHLTTNEALVEEIDWEYLLEYKYPPFCFVTEDGEWIEKGEMGWFGVSFDEIPEDSWKTQFSNYIKELDPDCLVTVIDFHI